MSHIYQQKKHHEQTREDRFESYFYKLRKFHNSIKKILYDKYCKNIDNLLELASGKSGDMQKWVSNDIKHVVGYDIDNNSIEEGKRRVKEAKLRIKGNFPRVELYVKDLSKNVILPIDNNLFDVISSQFAFHYFFESEETFNTILESIKLNIKPDGLFMGTMFDGKSLLNLKNPESNIVELTDKDVRFRLNFFPSLTTESLFGKKVSVYIKDTVLDEPMVEYLVDFESFVNLMMKNDFELIETKMFESFYSNYVNASNELNSLQKEISFLNRTFVFQYKGYKGYKGSTQKCKEQTEYLTECEWSNEEYNIIVLYKYIKALDNKINSSLNEIKEKLLYIKYNFLHPETILEKESVSDDIKLYYKHIRSMYLSELH